MSTRPSRTHRLLFAGGVTCAILLAIAAPASTALAQQDAASLPQPIIASSSPLTEAQRTRVREFAETWIRALGSADPTQVARGRAELAAPPGRPGATPAFHREYASVLRPLLDPIIRGDDEFRAVNALIVLRSLRTPEAVESLVGLTSHRNERRGVIRVRAASLLVDAISEPVSSGAPLSAAQIDRIARDVAEAAATDPEWVASYHGFRALSRIAGRAGLPPSSITLALESQATVLRRLVERAERDAPPSEVVHAIGRSLLVTRDQLTGLSDDNATAFRRALVGPLARLAKVAETHWDSARENPDARRAYGEALNAANLLLRLEARARNRPISIDLGAKWRADDRAGFGVDVAAAQGLASTS